MDAQRGRLDPPSFNLISMKYFSLFSGIGGFELGIQQTYENINRLCDSNKSEAIRGQNDNSIPSDLLQQSGCAIREQNRGNIGNKNKLSAKKVVHELSQMGAEPENSANIEGGASQHPERPLCIGYSEIDKYAVQIYQSHFPEHKNYGDITKIKAEDLPDFDLLVGGFPCQAFSIAGKRKGFEDTRGTLFFEIARILRAKQPRLLLLENVKGLLSHDSGKTFATIISTLDELGYDLQWQVLNSKNYGVPQNRERVFIVGHLRGTSRPQVFPITADGAENNGVSGHIANSLTTAQGGFGNSTYIANTLTRRYEGAQAVGTYIGEGKLYAQEDLMIRDGRDNRSCLRSGRTPELGVKGFSIRRLTPKECERLQGFPDGWTEGVSDTQRYKTLGNAVSVPVIKAIIERMILNQ